MKQPIRFFSIGLLTASLIILIVISFFDDLEEQVYEGSVDEMIAALKDEGYHVLSSSEYITLTVATETEKDNEKQDTNDKQNQEDDSEDVNDEQADEDDGEDSEDANDEQADDDNSEEVYDYTLTIEPNMLGPTISQLLVDNNIIDDADEFNRYLETEGYAPYLQLGEHNVSSDMSYYEVAEIIARSQ